MSKNPNVNFSFKDVMTAMKTPEVKAALRNAYAKEYSDASLRELVFEIAYKTAELGNGPSTNISIVVKDSDKSRGRNIDKVVKAVGEALAPVIKRMANSYVEVKRNKKSITQTQDLNQNKPIVNPVNHPGELTSLVELYNHLEPHYEYFYANGWVKNRDQFYYMYFDYSINDRQTGISYLSGFNVLTRSLELMEYQCIFENDEHRALTTLMIDEFCKKTNKTNYQKTNYLNTPKFYKKFLNGVNTLNSFVKEVDETGEHSFFDLSFDKQKNYIILWVRSNMSAYEHMDISGSNEHAEIGFIAGETEESRTNAIHRFKSYLSKERAGSDSKKKMPKKTLKDF